MEINFEYQIAKQLFLSGTRAIQKCMELYGITHYERFSDRDTDMYEFESETPDIGNAITEKMTLIYSRPKKVI